MSAPRESILGAIDRAFAGVAPNDTTTADELIIALGPVFDAVDDELASLRDQLAVLRHEVARLQQRVEPGSRHHLTVARIDSGQ